MNGDEFWKGYEAQEKERAIAATLGPEIERYRADMAESFAGMIIGALFFIVGITGLIYEVYDITHRDGPMPFFSQKGNCWVYVVLIMPICIGVAWLGCFFIKLSLSIITIVVIVRIDGFELRNSGSILAFRWENIRRFDEELVRQMNRIQGIPLPKTFDSIQYSYKIVRDDGAIFEFGSWTVKNYPLLAAKIHRELVRRGIHFIETHTEE